MLRVSSLKLGAWSCGHDTERYVLALWDSPGAKTVFGFVHLNTSGVLSQC